MPTPSHPPGTIELRVDRTWDGRPIPPQDVAVVRVVAAGGGLRLEVEAPFHGDPPPPGPPGPTPGLWEHEVVELFVAGPDGEAGPEYLEVELSPHGHHLVLLLCGVRRPVAEGLPLDFRAAIAGGRWRGEAFLPAAWLPPAPHRAAAFAIHGRGDGRRHLASVALPGPRPDFHRPADYPAVLLPVGPGDGT